MKINRNTETVVSHKKFMVVLLILSLLFVGLLSYYSKLAKDRKICTRNESYIQNTKFEKVLNFVYNRIDADSSSFDNQYVKLTRNYKNCLNIKYLDYTESKEKLGLFILNKDSNLSNLQIYINPAYKDKSDIFTALILTHELTHVGQYIESVTTSKKKQCFDQEVDAFKNMLAIFAAYSIEDKASIINDIAFSVIPDETASTLKKILGYSTEAWNLCKLMKTYNKKCFNTLYTNWIRDTVKESTKYQRQCN